VHPSPELNTYVLGWHYTKQSKVYVNEYSGSLIDQLLRDFSRLRKDTVIIQAHSWMQITTHTMAISLLRRGRKLSNSCQLGGLRSLPRRWSPAGLDGSDISLLIRQLLRDPGPVDKLLRRRGRAPCVMHQEELAPSYMPVLASEAAIKNYAMTTNPCYSRA